MKKLTFILLAILATSCSTSRLYYEVGAGVHLAGSNPQPEVNLPGPLGRYALGVEFDDGWTIEGEHISSVPEEEVGDGLNTLWFNRRGYF